MHVFGASSLAAAVNTLNSGVFKRRRCLTAIPGLHLVQRSDRFPCKQSNINLTIFSVYTNTLSISKSSSGMTPLTLPLHCTPQTSTTL